MNYIPHFILLILIFLVGAWAGTKWPQVNLIGKVTG
jgi:hypothetical protein